MSDEITYDTTAEVDVIKGTPTAVAPAPVDGLGCHSGSEMEKAARAAGLRTVRLETQSCRVEFADIAAVVAFLRKVVWTVPSFEVDRYRPALLDLHRTIEREGVFVSSAQRYLLEARAPG